ncbi:MAG: 5-methyltetrahydropteroyltriglutamate--homocysteine methyltransferase [Haloarculaceae archaeon]
MTDVVATTLGLLPGPPETDGVVTTGDADGTVPNAVDVAPADATLVERVLGWQREAGLDRLTTGQPGWRDGLASPLLAAAGVDAVSTGADGDSSRNRHRNRRPRLTGDPDPIAGLDPALDDVAGSVDVPLLAVVPGPYTLATLAVGNREPDALLTAITDWLSESVARDPTVETAVIHEPALVRRPPPDGVDARASEAIDRISKSLDATVLVHLAGGAPTEKVYAHLLDADFDAVGFDLTADPEGCLYLANEYGTTDAVGLGVIDAAAPIDGDLLDERVRWWLDNTPAATFRQVFATPGDGLGRSDPDDVGAVLSALGAVDRFDTAVR